MLVKLGVSQNVAALVACFLNTFRMLHREDAHPEREQRSDLDHMLPGERGCVFTSTCSVSHARLYPCNKLQGSNPTHQEQHRDHPAGLFWLQAPWMFWQVTCMLTGRTAVFCASWCRPLNPPSRPTRTGQGPAGTPTSTSSCCRRPCRAGAPSASASMVVRQHLIRGLAHSQQLYSEKAPPGGTLDHEEALQIVCGCVCCRTHSPHVPQVYLDSLLRYIIAAEPPAASTEPPPASDSRPSLQPLKDGDSAPVEV